MGEYVSTQMLVIHHWAGPSVIAHLAPDSTPDSNPQPLAYMDKGTTTCAKGEPEVIGRGSSSYPVEEHCSRS